ncbi:related to gliotoxin biosynthesis protein GliK [Ramularia collo-cygni]|uniref:gamma-glutamylcyclotransferase n=1 Tax=Ramularia collo-cygni TaxID=112498 RepID=A0A2D3V4V7_9PEZI|nr:related to gliotoxin biosynthesis protein GliK [Ramularia collo-cygni]CZT16519.1 related to gliotoxin biosynthesis protein GliK [Ramularia collo-cygni]
MNQPSIPKHRKDNNYGTDKIWYFAFGSNMVYSVMKKRGLDILDTRTATVPGYVLTFDVYGLPYSEPAMASIAAYDVDVQAGNRDRPPDVCGVAYLLSVRDFRRLVATEGGGVAYKEIQVSGSVITADTESITLYTLTAIFPRRPNAAPSSRYLGLLIQGAKESGLPESYQAYLRSLLSFTPPNTFRERLGACIFLFFGRRIMRQLAGMVKAATNEHGVCPSWYGDLIYYIYTSFWIVHDWMFAPVFGRGDGGGVAYGPLVLAVG